jgi:hypothetical protein
VRGTEAQNDEGGMTMVNLPHVDELEYNRLHVMGRVENTFVNFVKETRAQAMREGIKANSIIINENMVRVPEFTFCDVVGGVHTTPKMFCGLNVYLTKDELPENYSFAVFEGRDNSRLAQFESIGMEPEELRKAAELYRRVKEVME